MVYVMLNNNFFNAVFPNHDTSVFVLVSLLAELALCGYKSYLSLAVIS